MWRAWKIREETARRLARRNLTRKFGPPNINPREFTDFKHWRARLVEIDTSYSESTTESYSSFGSTSLLTPSSGSNQEFFEEAVLCTEPEQLVAVGTVFMDAEDIIRPKQDLVRRARLGILPEDDGHPDSTVVTLPLEIRAIESCVGEHGRVEE